MRDEDHINKERQQTIESKYIQQHLASERTFLAWIRTAIAIIGVGFLVTNLHFTMRSSLSPAVDLLANIIGLASVGLGILTIIMAIVTYMKKIDAINTESFRTSKFTIVTLGVFVIVIALIFGAYFLMI
ncbi:YidH family protein [Bacillus sp. SCS-153A]|uniref:YidH family protein n=1 Tax=Rossellomorea sedimentorum TaxID=3115294 RepID=UPI0039064980